jgi:putative ABC transport system permease protein
MKTPLAWLNLIHNRVRTAVAVSGVAFAIVLMFMQLGFLEAVKASATLIYKGLDFDICIRSPDYLNMADARTFPGSRLLQAKGTEGVARGAAFQTSVAPWRNPTSGEKRGILVMGIGTADDVFLDPQLNRTVRQSLKAPEDVLIDTKTSLEFGPRNGSWLDDANVGLQTEIGGSRIRVAGHFTRGAGLIASGAVLINDRGFRDVVTIHPPEQVSFGFLKLKAGARPDEVAARMRKSLPDDVEVLTRAETLTRETRRWVWETNYGLIFFAGVVVAVIVGTAIVYQVLVSEVTSLLPEYATMRAMGYRDRYLAGIVLQQALALALGGFVPGLVLSQIMYRITSSRAGIPVEFTWFNFFLVLGLSIVMCMVSGLLAMRKTFLADPADLF